MENKPVLWLTIAGSAEAPEDRNVGWDIKTKGWKGFVRDVVKPAIKDLGVQRILLHNPFGARPEEKVFQFDQYVAAREQGLRWLTNGFATYWRPITESGVEVIAYIGMMQEDADFDELAKDIKFADDWLQRVLTSIKPLLDAKMSIALDVASQAPENHPIHRLAQLLVSLGVKIYIEPRPHKDCKHWFHWDIIGEYDFFLRSDPDVHEDSAKWAAKTSDLTGEIVLFMRWGNQLELEKAIREKGFTPSGEHRYFQERKAKDVTV